MHIEGDFTADIFSFIEININACTNTTDSLTNKHYNNIVCKS
jgi:hypothetical protein